MNQMQLGDILVVTAIIVVVAGFFLSFVWRLYAAGNSRDREDSRRR